MELLSKPIRSYSKIMILGAFDTQIVDTNSHYTMARNIYISELIVQVGETYSLAVSLLLSRYMRRFCQGFAYNT